MPINAGASTAPQNIQPALVIRHRARLARRGPPARSSLMNLITGVALPPHRHLRGPPWPGMHRTRNAAYGQPYRGFESLPLRQSSRKSQEIQIVTICLLYTSDAADE